MIKFTKLRYKNFLSSGNSFTEIDFSKSPTTLVVGHNGSGKSTLLDAIAFGLFGKAYRSISKNQLVNSINKKDTVVEISFSVSGSDYTVRRGIKPNIFEIYRNGEMMNQSSHSKEYQKILEQNILKLNHKSFHQIVVLGSSSFIPFMQLNNNHRREVIEDLLDINVFSKMNNIMKEKQSMLKEDIKELNNNISLYDTKIMSQKKYINDIKSINATEKDKKYSLIEEYNIEIEKLQNRNIELSEYIRNNQPDVEKNKEIKEKRLKDLNNFKTKFNSDVKRVVKDVEFFNKNESCPSCKQNISEDLRDNKINEYKDKSKELKKAIDDVEVEINKTDVDLKEILLNIEEIRKCQNEINTNNVSIKQYQDSIDRTQQDIDKLSEATDLNSSIEELEELENNKDSMTEKKLTLNEQFNYNMVIGEMLKDTGIKTKIVKQYIPVINNFVNNYLQTLDFFVQFHLDENFQETIKSRYRDTFSYASFSEGEKQRIDLALLFTWRHIAKMKNSVATNLLILDETFDSSLDDEGIDNLLKIVQSLGDDTNVFIISHKGDILDNKFTSKIEFYKDKNFSKMR
jgi:DNA repair exonuclease SbcCD ATPase subunit